MSIRLVRTYEITTEESSMEGDFADHGFATSDGQYTFSLPELYEAGLSPQEAHAKTSREASFIFVKSPKEAARYIIDELGFVERSSSVFHPGDWYTQIDAQFDMNSGGERRDSFHPEGTVRELCELDRALMKLQNRGHVRENPEVLQNRALSQSARARIPPRQFVFSKERTWPVESSERAMRALTFSTWPQHKERAKEVQTRVKRDYPEVWSRFKGKKVIPNPCVERTATEWKDANEKAKKDPRVLAIRTDKLVGCGTCSSIDECMDATEIVDILNEEGIKEPIAAVKWAREQEGLWLEQGTNTCWGEDDDPQLLAYKDYQEKRRASELDPSSPLDTVPLSELLREQAHLKGYEAASYFHRVRGYPVVRLNLDTLFIWSLKNDSVARLWPQTEEEPQFWEFRGWFKKGVVDYIESAAR